MNRCKSSLANLGYFLKKTPFKERGGMSVTFRFEEISYISMFLKPYIFVTNTISGLNLGMGSK